MNISCGSVACANGSSVAFSNGISLLAACSEGLPPFQWMFTGIVQWTFSDIFQWNFPFVRSGVQ